MILAGSTWAGVPATPFDGNANPVIKPVREVLDPSKDPGELVDFAAALAAGADYLKHAQADATEDNAGNGVDGVDETPDDPDDGGWDWVMTDPAFTHSTAVSPSNIYGATAQGLYYAYLATGDGTYKTALDDAAATMAADPNIRSGGDMVFLMKYNDLPGVLGTAFMDAARAKYDGRITTYGSATALAQYIRDVRGVTQGYPNGIIGWDVGIYAVIATMLDARYPGNGYDADADDIAEVLWQDSFNDNPGLFDVIDDQGYDPTYTDKNFYWYNLGITGLIDAFAASGSHTAEIPGLLNILLASQASDGSVSYSYGGFDADWQSTAYSVLTLAGYDQATYQYEINKMAYWIGATQQASSGGWVYSSLNHYPEEGGENCAALYYGEAPTDVVVDDDFVDQAAVDVYNTANGTSLVWGYDAFDNVQDGIAAVSGSTVNVMPGNYSGNIVITAAVNLLGAQAGVDARGRTASESVLTVSSGNLLDIRTAGVVIDGFHLTGSGSAGQLIRCESGGAGLKVENCIIDGVAQAAFWFNTTAPGVLINQNDIDASGMTGSNAIAHFDGSDVFDDLVISNNDLAGGAIFAGNKVYNSDNMLMTYNLFDGASINLSSQFKNSEISYNTFRNNGYTNGQVGLLNGLIKGNTFEDTGPSPHAGYPSYSLMLWGNSYSLTPSQNVLIEDNTFHTNGFAAPAELAQGLRILTGIDATTITVQNNQFLDGGQQTGALAMLNQGTGIAPASCNWWGHVDGPNHLSNPSSGADVGDAIIFWPWLDGVGGNCDQYGNNNVAALDPSGCVTPGNPCVTVPVVFNRTDATPSRGISVTFQLSPELALCTPAALSDINVSTGTGSWAAGYSNLNYQILDNGGGSFTVDQAILGVPCGPTAGGELFTVDVTLASGVTADAVGLVTVTSVIVRDCNNLPLPGLPGAPAEVTIDLTSPPVLAGLAAAQIKTGNDSDGTTKIGLSWTAPGGDAATIEIFRKGYGDYPEYDDGTGAVPAAPVTLANGWTSVATVAATTTSYVDEPATRDFYYYAAYVTDTCGNVSAASGLTDGTLNYHLGDVHDTSTPGSGDNLVNTSDISHLGFNYGALLVYGDPLNYLDVGPTTDWSVDARPTTDNKVQFEDLMMFAINYGQVSKSFGHPAPAGFNLVDMTVDPVPGLGEVFSVALRMTGDGTIQGLSVPVEWDPSVVEPVGMVPGNLLEQQGGLTMVLSPEPGTVDAALFGVRDAGISGEGILATIQFRVVAQGEPGLGFGDIIARDKENAEVLLEGSSGSITRQDLPAVSILEGNVPNPFNPKTQISFVVARDGQVNVSVYTLRGQLVATLINEEMTAGRKSVEWNGIDAEGRSVASGIYLVRFSAPDRTMSRQITLLK
ncbi:right-handed parallel beta-helix repeat-containing protein [bacterium]|nr:right-handed parallel beta-helix repeat-containing protein [bacterium]